MTSKQEICGNWLQRYTKLELSKFGDLILLTNFNNYVDMFCEQMNVEPVGEGTSNDYFPPEVPALPAFMLQRAISTALRDASLDYWTGTVYTTNRRVWEHDEEFKAYLRRTRAMAVDMETATLFSCGFYNHIPTGALLLVSDNPMTPEGVKTERSDNHVTSNFAATHVRIGIESLRLLQGDRKTVRHLKFDW